MIANNWFLIFAGFDSGWNEIGKLKESGVDFLRSI